MRKLKDRRGLTLIEIIVSIAILGMIVVPLSSMFTQSIKTNMSARARMTANQLAQKQMEELKHSSTVMLGSSSYQDSASGLVVESLIEPFQDSSYRTDVGEEDTKAYDAVITIEKDYSNRLKINADSEISFTAAQTLQLQLEENKLTYTLNSVSNNVPYNMDELVNIKLLCYGETSLKVHVSNLSSKQANLYVVKAKADSREIGSNEILITTEEGKVNSYYNIYDKSVLSPDLAAGKSERLYKITIKVKKGSNELISINGLRSVK